MRSMHSTSKTTCSHKTSSTDRVTVIIGLRSDGRPVQANQPRYVVHTPDRSFGHGLNPSDRSPSTRPTTTCLVGLGRSPVRYWCGALAHDCGASRDRCRSEIGP